MNRPHSPNRRIRCLNPACRRPAMARGLCMGCYQSARRLVRLGRVTWDQLIAMGRALAPVQVRNHASPRKDWLMAPVAVGSTDIRADLDSTPEALKPAAKSDSVNPFPDESEPADFMDLPK